jgi:hypothetical protein
MIYFAAMVWTGYILTNHFISNPMDIPIKPIRKKKMKKDLMGWQIYRSNRFIVHGNIGWRIIVKDYHENMAYDIEHTDLVKFRKHWDNIKKRDSKEKYLIIVIMTHNGKPISKEKVVT